FRYVSKYRHCDGKLVLKATDDRVCIKFRTDQAQDAKKMERLNNLLFTLMARGPDAITLSHPYIPHPHLTMLAPLPRAVAAAVVPNSCGGVTVVGAPAASVSAAATAATAGKEREGAAAMTTCIALAHTIYCACCRHHTVVIS
ncbi:unnamed protein product, partial [Closterium sp. NIES-54]